MGFGGTATGGVVGLCLIGSLGARVGSFDEGELSAIEPPRNPPTVPRAGGFPNELLEDR